MSFRIRVIGTNHWLGSKQITEALQEASIPGVGVKLRGALYPASWWVPEIRAKVWPNLSQLKGCITRAEVKKFPVLEIVFEDGTVKPLDEVSLG